MPFKHRVAGSSPARLTSLNVFQFNSLAYGRANCPDFVRSVSSHQGVDWLTMLAIFRRHNKTRHDNQGCPHGDDPYYKRCHCPMWIRGTVDGREIKESLKTRSWEKAEAERNRRNQSDDPAQPKAEPITLANAVDQFLIDSESRGCGRTDGTCRPRWECLIFAVRGVALV